MDLLFSLLDHFVGDDTDPIDLLPLLVLGFLVYGVRHLRVLILQVFQELGALRERIDILQELRSLKHTLTKENTP